MTIRHAQASDANAWAAMRSSLWPDADAADLAREANGFVAGERSAAIDEAFVAIADDGAAVIGFLELSIRPFSDGCDSMPVPHVEGWYVEPAARGRGIGRALVEAARIWARARGYVELASDAELDDVRSHAAHRACGFEEVDRIVKFRARL